MNYNYLKNIADNVKLELNKTDVNCRDVDILTINAQQFQILFTLTKDDKIYRYIQTISYDDIDNNLPKIVKENIIKRMIRVIK